MIFQPLCPAVTDEAVLWFCFHPFSYPPRGQRKPTSSISFRQAGLCTGLVESRGQRGRARPPDSASELECCTHTSASQNRPKCSAAASARDHITIPYSVGTEGRKIGKVYLANYFLMLFPSCERQLFKTNIVGK